MMALLTRIKINTNLIQSPSRSMKIDTGTSPVLIDRMIKVEINTRRRKRRRIRKEIEIGTRK